MGGGNTIREGINDIVSYNDPAPFAPAARGRARRPVAGREVGVFDVGAAGAGRDVVKCPALVARRCDEVVARGVDRDARHVRRVLLERVRRGARGRIPDLDCLVGRGRKGDIFCRVEEHAGYFLGVSRHGRDSLAAAAVQQHNLVVGAPSKSKVVLGRVQIEAKDLRRLQKETQHIVQDVCTQM
jgi:hypothetical protein